MRFRVKVGVHSEGGVLYEAGSNDIVETDIDLIRAFNSAKFERVTVPLDDVQSHVTFSHDATDQFDGCVEMGLQVFHESGLYYVVDKEKGQPIHESKISSKDTVREVLAGMK